MKELNPTTNFDMVPKAFGLDKQMHLACSAPLLIKVRLIRQHPGNHGPWMWQQGLPLGANAGSVKKAAV